MNSRQVKTSRRGFLKTLGCGIGGVFLPGFITRSSVRDERPNILFCISDDQSYPHAGAYGCAWVKTSGFDRVAREGILFSRAYTPNAKCAPSRSCLLTGRNSWQLEAAANHWPYFPEKFKTFPEVLAEHGYHVGYTGKGWGPGIAERKDGSRRLLTGVPYNRRTTKPPALHMSSNDYAANFRDFLDAAPADRPFCFWYGSTEPHRAYGFQAGIRKGGKSPAEIERVPDFWPDNETVRADMLDYAFEIEYFDRHLGTMLGILEEKGMLDNTLVVATSDNGMPFPRIKGQAYERSNHIPFAAMWKAGIRNPGRTVDDFVSFIDLAPMFLDLAGVAHAGSGMQPIAGKSLTDIFRSSRSGTANRERDHVLVGKERHDVGRPNDAGYPIRGIVEGEYLYLRNFETGRWPAGNPETGYLNCDGGPTKTECLKARKKPETKAYWDLCFGKRPAEELYRIQTDRDCVHNLAGNPDFRPVQDRLKKRLFDELKRQGDPRMAGRGDAFDQYPYADEKNRNFYEKMLKGEKVDAGWVNPSDFEIVE